MCQELAEQCPLIKGQNICQASLSNQEMGLLPTPLCGYGECGYVTWGLHRGQGRCWKRSRIRRNLFRIQIISKPLSSLPFPANTHRGNSKRFNSKSQGCPVTSLCHPFCGSAQGQSHQCRRGREVPASSFLSAQGSEATPSTLAQQRETGLNPK